MHDPHTARPSSRPPAALVSAAWLVPGLPLLWGVWQTLIKVSQLFQ